MTKRRLILLLAMLLGFIVCAACTGKLGETHTVSSELQSDNLKLDVTKTMDITVLTVSHAFDGIWYDCSLELCGNDAHSFLTMDVTKETSDFVGVKIRVRLNYNALLLAFKATLIGTGGVLQVKVSKVKKVTVERTPKKKKVHKHKIYEITKN